MALIQADLFFLRLEQLQLLQTKVRGQWKLYDQEKNTVIPTLETYEQGWEHILSPLHCNWLTFNTSDIADVTWLREIKEIMDMQLALWKATSLDEESFTKHHLFSALEEYRKTMGELINILDKQSKRTN